MTTEEDVKDVGDRIEALLGEIRAEAAPEAMTRVEELVARIVGLYGEGLARICAALGEDATSLDRVRDALVDDPVVATLLVLHGLHPEDLRARVERALASSAPYLKSHGGSARIVAIDADAGVLTLRLEGTCGSCASSTATLRHVIEQAVTDAAPEIAEIRLEEDGLSNATSAAGAATGASEALVTLRRKGDGGAERAGP